MRFGCIRRKRAQALLLLILVLTLTACGGEPCVITVEGDVDAVSSVGMNVYDVVTQQALRSGRKNHCPILH